MQGKRVDFGLDHPQPLSGEYGKGVDGHWYVRPPWKHASARLGAAHKVEEHSDGTITVTPSIVVETSVGVWHGVLERGIWREV